MSKFEKFTRWWEGAFRPWKHTWAESMVMRLAVATCMFIWWTGKSDPAFSKLDEPIGLALFFNLEWLGDPKHYQIVHALVLWGLIGYVLGGLFPLLESWRGRHTRDWLTPLSLLTATLSHVLIQTNLNSNGATYHGSLAIALVMCTQTIVHWIALFRHDPIRKDGLHWENLAIYYSIITLAASYTTSAITKLSHSGIGWMTKSHLVVVQMARTGEEFYLDKLKKEREGTLDFWIDQFCKHPNLVRAGLTAAWFIEFFAFLALLSRRWALIIGIAIAAMHRGIGITMALFFPLNEILALALMVNLPFWLWFQWRKKNDATTELETTVGKESP